MNRYPSPYDGRPTTYWFGSLRSGSSPLITATSLRQAILTFRVGHLNLEQWADKEDGLIPIGVKVKGTGWTEIMRLAVTVPADEELDARTLALLGQSSEVAPESTTTAVALAGADTGLRSASRTALEEKQHEITLALAGLELQKRELERQVQTMRAELNRRMEQIWIIELFIGSNEQVHVLREGSPAPAATPITVRQAVLCMDEEIAVHDWFKNPARIGTFDHRCVTDFDAWLLQNPDGLDAICPWPRGIVGLRVRRMRVDRPPPTDICEAQANDEDDLSDRMTYLLIRNGENLYRLWIDVDLWPRLFASDADSRRAAGEPKEPGEHVWTSDTERAQQRVKHQVAGLVAVQGIIERSILLHPLPFPALSVFDPRHADAFQLIRDGEEVASLTDQINHMARIRWNDATVYARDERGHTVCHLAQKGYRSWLKEQTVPGVRVLYVGRRHDSGDYGKIRDRVGAYRGLDNIPWPKHGVLYTLEDDDGVRNQPLAFKYLPDDRVYPKAAGLADDEDDSVLWEGRPRTRRVTFGCYPDEVIPVDFLSWRVLEYLIRDRAQRADYGDFFRIAFDYWRLAREDAQREAPFVDLVLSRIGWETTPADRARCERLVRWWKIKTKEHRTLGADEAKAYRMIRAAFLRGDDHENDPEHALLRST